MLQPWRPRPRGPRADGPSDGPLAYIWAPRVGTRSANKRQFTSVGLDILGKAR